MNTIRTSPAEQQRWETKHSARLAAKHSRAVADKARIRASLLEQVSTLIMQGNYFEARTIVIGMKEAQWKEYESALADYEKQKQLSV